jgi:hypothetical protein
MQTQQNPVYLDADLDPKYFHWDAAQIETVSYRRDKSCVTVVDIYDMNTFLELPDCNNGKQIFGILCY